jgi:hypothetical protein
MWTCSEIAGQNNKNPRPLLNICEGVGMKKGSYTHEEFVNKVASVNPNVKILSEFKGVENKISIECQHQGVNEVYAYRLLKPNRHCCKKGYHQEKKGKTWISLEDRKQKYSCKLKDICFEHSFLLEDQKLHNLFCKKHNIHFNQWFSSLNLGIGCPECGRENKRKAGLKMIKIARKKQLDSGKAKFVSKNETKWLDSLNVPVRQKWLEDIRYSVDGFDPSTNTVFLYHGRFWHGCPVKFDPEMIHPILKIKMKQLYDRTIMIENRIRLAGYNLITIWGE